MHLTSSVQGIVNRNRSTLFVRFSPNPDDFWWNHLRSEGEWLHNRPVKQIGSITELLKVFQSQLKGTVVYDPRVPATSNVASTIAGVESRVCLRYDPSPDSLYSQVSHSKLSFTANEYRLMNDDGSVMFDATASPTSDAESPDVAKRVASAKCNAYLWAKERYLDTGMVSKSELAYYIDLYWLRCAGNSSVLNSTVMNHDYFIANQSFFTDLHVWEDEAPVDDPDQPVGTDTETLTQLLAAMKQQADGNMYYMGGFIPWAYKYTNYGPAGSHHEPVATEWKLVKMLSANNAILDADALGFSGMANASFYQHHPQPEQYPLQNKPTLERLQAEGLVDADGKVKPATYVAFYMGDYDSAAWFHHHVPLLWSDEAHGKIPCGWAINPSLDRRAPHAMYYARTHAAASDYFMSGDCGAGYINPGEFANTNHADESWQAWIDLNKRAFHKYDLSLTGFVIDGLAPRMDAAGLGKYAEFSPDGIGTQGVYDSALTEQALREHQLPVVPMATDLYGEPAEAGKRLAELPSGQAPHFLFVRTILKTPSWHQQTAEQAQQHRDIKFVDPYTLFLLYRLHHCP
ncbi:GxGYxYP domain-containing protein [Aeoliella mucimassa]|nr:GxGYxYP domain-containing protein [Aeoliella mucimassa]